MSLDPLVAGILGSALVLWVSFVPCFLWIFLGAPYIERLAGNRKLSAALTAITAAVAGVILNLAVWFALHVLFATVDERQWGILRAYVPDFSGLDVAALGLSLLAAIAVFRFRLGLVPVLAGAAVLGLALRMTGIA